jgi:hypothetical protein
MNHKNNKNIEQAEKKLMEIINKSINKINEERRNNGKPIIKPESIFNK